MTLPKVRLWQALLGSSLSGVRFRRQHALGTYVLDFYAPLVRLAVEIDGTAHDHPAKVCSDGARDGWLAAQHIRVLSFNARDVLDRERREDVLATIAAVVEGSQRALAEDNPPD